MPQKSTSLEQQNPEANSPSAEAVEFEPSMGTPLGLCIKVIAQGWYGYNNQEDVSGEYNNPTDRSTPEVLRSYAADLGIKIEYSHRRVIKYAAKSFPYIYVLKNGKGVIVTGTTGTGLQAIINGQLKEISKETVENFSELLVIIPRPLDEPSHPAQTKKDPANQTKPAAKSAIFWLLGEITQHHKATLFQMMIAALIGNMLMLALPLFIMNIYDRVIPHGAMETLWALSLGMFIAVGVDIALRRVRLKLADAVAIASSVSLQTRLLKVLANAKLQDTPRNMGIWTNSFREIDHATVIIPGLVAALFVDLPFVLAILVLIYSIAGNAVLAPVIGMGLFGLWTFFAQRSMAKHGATDASRQNEKAGRLSEMASHIRTIKATNNQDEKIVSFERLVNNAIPSTHALRLQTSMQTQTTAVLIQLVIVIAIIASVYQITSGTMTVGALAATTLLIGRVLLPAGNIVMLSANVGRVTKTLGHIYEILKLPQETSDQNRNFKSIVQGELTLNDVSFKFDDQPHSILDNISLSIKPGEKIAIIGRSGSGKSTLLQLICRIYEPTSGCILIDQFDCRQFSHKETRRNIVLMTQDTQLFNASIDENLRIANPNADQDQILNALSVAGGRDFIRSIPEGLSFQVGHNGERLSGGERQTLGLARALLSDSKILLLDEPTAAMDNSTENVVIENLLEAVGNRTLIVSTHRANVLQMVDRIIWLEKGKIIADGPRQDVLAKIQKK